MRDIYKEKQLNLGSFYLAFPLRLGYDGCRKTPIICMYAFKSVYHAIHMRKRARMPESLEMELNALCAGDIVFATAPFEMFNSGGRFIKAKSPFKMTFVLACCNGFHSYLPDEKAFATVTKSTPAGIPRVPPRRLPKTM